MPQQRLSDIATRNQVYLEGYKAGEVTQFDKFLKVMTQDVQSILSRDDITDFTRSKFEQMLNQIGVIMNKSLSDYEVVWKQMIDEISLYQAGFEQRALSNVVSGVNFSMPSDAQIMASVYATPIGNIAGANGGALLADYFTSMKADEVKRVQGAIRLGYAEGQTNEQIIKRVRGTKAAGYTDGIWNTTRRNVENVVRTSVQHAASYARESIWQENKSVIKGVKWVSTLDSRTSAFCRATDSQVFPMDKGPRPPAHINACLEGTKILTSEGFINIEHVKVGDYVKTHTGKFQRVYTVMAREHNGLARDLINNLGSCVRLTNEHPVLTLVEGWVEAGNIKTGDVFFHDSKQLNWFDRIFKSAFIPQAVLINSYNIETDVTKELISYGIFSSSSGVSSSIKLNNSIPDDKIRVVSQNSILKTIFHLDAIKDGLKELLMFCKVGFENNCQRIPAFFNTRLIKRRVNQLHSIGRGFFEGFKNIWAFFRPMIFPNWVGNIFTIVNNRLFSIFRFNAVFNAEFSNSIVRKVIFSLYSTKALPFAVMFRFNNILNLIFRKHDEYTSLNAAICSRIVEYHYSGYVYNLAVENDETYIADGIIVHNCRSTTTAVLIDKYSNLSEGRTRAARDPETGKVSPVSAKMTYYEWLKTQSEEFQDSVIGQTRGKLLRDGGISSERFAELQLSKTFKPLTLDEMRKLEPVAFSKAGL